MNQLPCNSLYCVPGRFVQLIWFYNTVDQAQKAVNDGLHGPSVHMLKIPLARVTLNISNKHPHEITLLDVPVLRS